MVLLLSLSTVPPPFLATPRCRASSICFVQIDSLLVHLLFLGSTCFVTIDKGAK